MSEHDFEALDKLARSITLEKLRPLTPELRRRWEAAKRGRPRKALGTKAVPTMITVEPKLLKQIDAYVKRAGISRSQLFAEAVRERISSPRGKSRNEVARATKEDSVSVLAQEILKRFRETSVAQVPGYYRFEFAGEYARGILVARQRGTRVKLPLRDLEKAVRAVANNPSVYSEGPAALRPYVKTHIHSPLWALLHLAPLDRFPTAA